MMLLLLVSWFIGWCGCLDRRVTLHECGVFQSHSVPCKALCPSPCLSELSGQCSSIFSNEQNLRRKMLRVEGCFLQERLTSYLHSLSCHARCCSSGCEVQCGTELHVSLERGNASLENSSSYLFPVLLCSLCVPHSTGNCQDL